MNWSEIGILYRRELRSAFRERSIVVNGVLIPIFLYPIMIWAMVTGLTFVQGVNEDFVTRVAVEGQPPVTHQGLLDTLAAHDRVEVRGGPGAGEDALAPEEWEDALARGELDAIFSFGPPDGAPAGLSDNFSVDVRYDRAEERSRQGRQRLAGILSDYRADWLAREADALSLSEADRTVFAMVGENISSSEELGQRLLGVMLSMILVLMVAIGCFLPSVDTTAGERERSTWETTMTLSASRGSVVTAKYLSVATLGILAGLLNVVAMMVSLGAILGPLLGRGEGALEFTMPWLAVPVMMAGAVALALLFASVMMLLAAFARSFKDGQAMAQSAVLLAIAPIFIGGQSDLNLSATTAVMPVVNVAMMIRDAIGGVFLWPWIGVTLAVTLTLVALVLVLARQVLRFEDFLIGAFDGSFWRFAKEKLFP